MIPTPHIEAKDKNIFAKTVLMPGDPLRAKWVAETYLEDVVMVNGVRNMLGYTGTYKGKKVTVMGSGMGMPSIGIYSYELFKFYDVENIIRVGSCGSYSKDINVYDVIISTGAYSESSFAQVAYGFTEDILLPSPELNDKLISAAKELNIKHFAEIIHSSDVFYRHQGDVFKDVFEKHQAVAVEMEAFALFANARYLNKNAACILTVSDSLVTHEATSSQERQESFNKMIEIALNAAIK